jgi:hypothetical protein
LGLGPLASGIAMGKSTLTGKDTERLLLEIFQHFLDGRKAANF